MAYAQMEEVMDGFSTTMHENETEDLGGHSVPHGVEYRYTAPLQTAPQPSGAADGKANAQGPSHAPLSGVKTAMLAQVCVD
ncbi:hypothetical protein T492DRAFT_901863 [Pavlovales sp. CCMP2436]|nr:hypothetical protein T492DRAFT_901863 [Pavlovales sp. CCMP2436]